MDKSDQQIFCKTETNNIDIRLILIFLIGGITIKRVFYVTSIFTIVILFLGGCVKTNIQTPKTELKKSEPQTESRITTNKTPVEFFPLTKGSTWQYQGEGNEYASFSREVLFTLDDRAQIREDNGGTVSSSIFESRDDQIAAIYFQEETYDETNFLEEEPNENLIILKTPLEVGTKWEYRNGTREIVDINATVETPAGEFEKCIVVRITFPDSTLFEYYKEGVGMVKREFISGDSRVTSILEKYKINT